MPSDVSKDPIGEPTPSTRQDLPPNNDAAMAKQEEATNPTKGGSKKVSEGTASIGKEGDVPTSDKSFGDKVKDKLPGK